MNPHPLTVAPSRRKPRLDRSSDRRATFAGVVVAAVFLVAAVLSLALPEQARLGIWLPLHLAVAGGAATAIAALLPFFTTTLAVAPPAPIELRAGAVLLVAGGATAVAFGHAGAEDRIATIGGVSYVLGLGLVAIVAFMPVRRALGPRRRLVERAYAVALADVVVGAALATGFLGGADAVLARWGSLKPAHAWLNLFGFVTLVIAATLVHLAPTIVGARIRRRPSATVAVTALAIGAPLVAIGYGLEAHLLAQLGGVVALAGAAALTIHAIGVSHERAAWTTDREWHVLTDGSIVAGPAWLLVATAIAAWRLLTTGAPAAAWSLTAVAPPLVAGFALQVLIAAWTHLVPAIGPGRPTEHARRRVVLGRFGRVRLIAWNVAVGALATGVLVTTSAAAGTPADDQPLAAASLIARLGIVGLAALAALALVLFGVAVGRSERSRTPATAPPA